MAKRSMVARDIKRLELINKSKERRDLLKKKSKDISLSLKERLEASIQLQKMPRDSSPSRYRNRCAMTGRPRGYYRRFGLAKLSLREKAMNGEIPGLVKSSW